MENDKGIVDSIDDLCESATGPNLAGHLYVLSFALFSYLYDWPDSGSNWVTYFCYLGFLVAVALGGLGLPIFYYVLVAVAHDLIF